MAWRSGGPPSSPSEDPSDIGVSAHYRPDPSRRIRNALLVVDLAPEIWPAPADHGKALSMRYGPVLTTALVLAASACSRAPTDAGPKSATWVVEPSKAPAAAARPAPAERKVGDFWVH